MQVRISSRAKRICFDSVVIAAALLLSYIESVAAPLIPFPVPGFRLGLANIAVIFAMYALGTFDAFVISVLRVTLSSLLFGSVSSFVFSLAGAVLSFAVLCICRYLIKQRLSVYGISVLSAAAHNIGQTFAAYAVMGTGAVFVYLPYLLLLSVPCGLLTGAAAGVLMKRKDILKFSE